MGSQESRGLGARFLERIATPDLPDLGPAVRPGRLPLAPLEQRLMEFLAEPCLPAPLQAAFHAAALLWHDHLEASHTLSQGIPSSDGSFLHGIMHRREPDYGNARYWFKRVGRHPAYAPLGRRVQQRLEAAGQRPLAQRLAPEGDWDPFAFIEACEEAAEAPADNPLRNHLQQVQAWEFEELIAHLAASGSGPAQFAR